MRQLATIALLVASFAAAVPAQAPTFTGKWVGTFLLARPDGTEGRPQDIVLELTQKGDALTGTAGPADRQWPLEKGTVTKGTAVFYVQQPNGPLFRFTIQIVKGRLQGDMTGLRDGVERGTAKVDAAREAPKK